MFIEDNHLRLALPHCPAGHFSPYSDQGNRIWDFSVAFRALRDS
jgi:hypothetical protein